MMEAPAISLACRLPVLIEPAEAAARSSRWLSSHVIGSFTVRDQLHEMRGYHFSGPPNGQDRIRLGFFAGIHGDEPAGCSALVRLLVQLAASPEIADGYDLWVYPVCNPFGYEQGTRVNSEELDLNREFWSGSRQPEVLILEAELRCRNFNGIVTLHADDTSEGVYGYAHGKTLNESLLCPALREAACCLPLNQGKIIDGFEASEGVIKTCFKGVLSAPPDQWPQPFDIIFETPAGASLELQVEAALAAVRSILHEYRGFIAHAANI